MNWYKLYRISYTLSVEMDVRIREFRARWMQDKHPVETTHLLKPLSNVTYDWGRCRLTNEVDPHMHNIWGAPSLQFIRKNGKFIGWHRRKYFSHIGTLPLYQTLSDVRNWRILFDSYKPDLVFDFGTAAGGSAVFFHDLMSAYMDATQRIVSIDLVDYISKNPKLAEFHRSNRSYQKIAFLAGDATSQTVYGKVKKYADSIPHERALFSFDDDHHSGHVMKELELYSDLAKDGRIVVQDTWYEGLSVYADDSAYKAVINFLEHNSHWDLDVDLLEKCELPINFIDGILIHRKN